MLNTKTAGPVAAKQATNMFHYYEIFVLISCAYLSPNVMTHMMGKFQNFGLVCSKNIVHKTKPVLPWSLERD